MLTSTSVGEGWYVTRKDLNSEVIDFIKTHGNEEDKKLFSNAVQVQIFSPYPLCDIVFEVKLENNNTIRL